LKEKTRIISYSNAFIALNKPNGYLSQKPENEDDPSIFEIRKLHQKESHILTRLDRPVSGVVLASLKKKFNQHFQKLQEQDKVTKTYLAIVEGKFEFESKTLEHFLHHNKKMFKSYVDDKQSDAFKPVKLEVSVLEKLDNYTVLKVVLNRGKFHQIRAQLSHIGYPIKGDVKYGARRGNKDRSIHLHAHKIQFQDIKGEKITITADIPEDDNLWKTVSHKLTSKL